MKEIISRLRADPESLLTSNCVLALGAFLNGYREAAHPAVDVFTELTGKFQGPDQANAFTRAYLSVGDTGAALRAVLDALEPLATANAVDSRPASVGLSTSFMEGIRERILDGRTGMVLGEPTVLWFADYVRGHTAGLAAVDPVAAQAQEDQLRAFEAWLREEYRAGATAPWYAIVRVYYGVDLDGLRGFLKLWDQFNAG